MKRLRTSNRVLWAPAATLRQDSVIHSVDILLVGNSIRGKKISSEFKDLVCNFGWENTIGCQLGGQIRMKGLKTVPVIVLLKLSLILVDIGKRVRLFSTEEIPAQVACKAQDCFKGEVSCKDSNCVDLTMYPPVLKGSNNVKLLKKELPLIPQIKWKCPPKFVLDSNWVVATGEEGKEAEVQKQREMGCLKQYTHDILPSRRVPMFLGT
ncbi:hypothetical protein RJ641_010662 [Dillenia turbinata]|uniref:Uncharacterized protein n=1 Tax=Dillenia turbinata TaxID=194707 RepID=A0AAN8VBV6_9MAGN